MNIIKRKLEDLITPQLSKNKVILIMGTRRVGKTVLVDTLRKKQKAPSILLSAEDFDVQDLLKNRSVSNYKRIIETLNCYL